MSHSESSHSHDRSPRDPNRERRLNYVDRHRLRQSIEAHVARSQLEKLYAAIADLDLTTDNHLFLAPTASGKTTTIPPLILARHLGEPRPGSEDIKIRRVFVIEPTRLTARAAASTANALYDQDPPLAGFRTGDPGDQGRGNLSGRVMVVTPGIFRILAKNGEVGPDDLVFFDEVHRLMEHPEMELIMAHLQYLRERGERRAPIIWATATTDIKDQSWRRAFPTETVELPGRNHRIEFQKSHESVEALVSNYLQNVVELSRARLHLALRDLNDDTISLAECYERIDIYRHAFSEESRSQISRARNEIADIDARLQRSQGGEEIRSRLPPEEIANLTARRQELDQAIQDLEAEITFFAQLSSTQSTLTSTDAAPISSSSTPAEPKSKVIESLNTYFSSRPLKERNLLVFVESKNRVANISEQVEKRYNQESREAAISLAAELLNSEEHKTQFLAALKRSFIEGQKASLKTILTPPDPAELAQMSPSQIREAQEKYQKELDRKQQEAFTQIVLPQLRQELENISINSARALETAQSLVSALFQLHTKLHHHIESECQRRYPGTEDETAKNHLASQILTHWQEALSTGDADKFRDYINSLYVTQEDQAFKSSFDTARKEEETGLAARTANILDKYTCSPYRLTNFSSNYYDRGVLQCLLENRSLTLKDIESQRDISISPDHPDYQLIRNLFSDLLIEKSLSRLGDERLINEIVDQLKSTQSDLPDPPLSSSLTTKYTEIATLLNSPHIANHAALLDACITRITSQRRAERISQLLYSGSSFYDALSHTIVTNDKYSDAFDERRDGILDLATKTANRLSREKETAFAQRMRSFYYSGDTSYLADLVGTAHLDRVEAVFHTDTVVALVYYSGMDIGVLEEQMKRIISQGKRLVLVFTWGSGSDGINLPIHDVIMSAMRRVESELGDDNGRDTRFGKPLTTGGSKLQEISTNDALQAGGRAGRTGPGIALIGDIESRSQLAKWDMENLQPIPLVTSLDPSRLSQLDLESVVLDLVSLGHTPQTMLQLRFYSRLQPESLVKTYDSLIAKGAITTTGSITEQTLELTSIPLNEPLHRECYLHAPRELRPLFAVMFSLGNIGFRDLFQDDLIANRNQLPIDQLLGTKYIDKSQKISLAHVLLNDVTAQSDFATLYNLVVYDSLHDSDRRKYPKLDWKALGISVPKMHAVKRQFKNMLEFMGKRASDLEFPLTQDSLDAITMHLIRENTGERIVVGKPDYSSRRRRSIILSQGTYQMLNDSEVLICPFVKTASTSTKFTEMVVARVPDSEVPWLPERIDDTVGNFFKTSLYLNNFKLDTSSTLTSKNTALLAPVPEVRKIINHCLSMQAQLDTLHHKRYEGKRMGNEEIIKQLFEKICKSERIITLAELNEYLVNHPDAVKLPQLEDYELTEEQVAEINTKYPDQTTINDHTYEISYLYGTGYIEIPHQEIDFQDGQFHWSDHPIFAAAESDLTSLPQFRQGIRFRLTAIPQGFGTSSFYYTTLSEFQTRYSQAIIDNLLREENRRLTSAIATEQPGILSLFTNSHLPVSWGTRPDGSPLNVWNVVENKSGTDTYYRQYTLDPTKAASQNTERMSALARKAAEARIEKIKSSAIATFNSQSI